MLVDATLPRSIAETKATAAASEAAGYDGLWTGETAHEPFMQLLQAAEATSSVMIGSQVAIAFARTPMTLAYAGWDLAWYSQGRFVLGLGSQVKAHVERRFSMPWSHPAPRMRELVLAMKTIWRSWQEEEPLKFEGEFYTHTLMTPFFSPPPHEWGPPPVYLAGVGQLMTETAGEVAEGFFFHPFTTPAYMREVTIPALLAGRAKAGHDGLDGFTISGPAFVCTGRDEAELAAAIKGTKDQIAFYASTPAYKGVLDMHGWGDLQPELAGMAREGRWSEMGDAIGDELLHEVAVVGGPAEAGRGLRERYGDIAQRISLYSNYKADPSVWPEVIEALRG